MEVSVYTNDRGQNVYLSSGTIFIGDAVFRNHIVNDLGFSHAVANHHIELIQKERRVPDPKQLSELAPIPEEKPKKQKRKRKK